MAEYVINLLGNICELFIILFFLKDNYKLRVKKKFAIPLCILFLMFQFANTNIFLGHTYLVMFGSLIFVFLVLLIFDMKLLYRILYTIVIYLIIALTEIILGMVLSLILKLDVSSLQNNILLYGICTLISKFLAYIFVLFIKIKRFIIKDKTVKFNAFWIFILPVASILTMILFLRCCYQIEDTGFHVVSLITSIVLIIANIAIFYIIDKQNELIETKERLIFAELHINNQVLHYQALNKHQTELRIFRHDIKNRLVSLMALIKEGQTDKALQIMENNLDWLDEANNNIVNSGNPIIDAILQSKLHAAKEKQISLQIKTKLAEEITIDELELGIVLGNALDNAIEAADKLKDKEKKYINLTLMSTEDRISISITNPVEDNVDTENLTTSKADKDKHGYGIKSIQAISQKYDGIVVFACEDNMFNININLANHAI